MRKEKLTAVCAAAAVLITGVVAAVIALNRKPPDEAPALTGGTEAVLTSPARVINGMTSAEAFEEEFYQPLGIALGADNKLYVADSMCDRIQVIHDGETVRYGNPGSSEISFADSGLLTDGSLADAHFKKPSSVALRGDDIYVCDTGNNAVRRISGSTVRTVAGGLGAGYGNGREGEVLFNMPRSIAVAPDGTVYVSDTMNHCIRAIDADGNVTLFAGKPGQSGYNGGDLLEAMFFEPYGIAFGPDGALYVADSANHAIRKIHGGIVSTVAGHPGAMNGEYPSGGMKDGDNANARFNFPADITVLPDGSIYAADMMNHSIRLIQNGVTRTVIGNGESGKYYSSIENLKLSKPSGITSDGTSLYISDTLNNAVVIVPITEQLKLGRPLRDELLEATGVNTATRYAYNGEIRLFVDGVRVRYDRVKPWATADNIYVPISALFTAMGAGFELDNKNDKVTVIIEGETVVLELNRSYFILRGAAVMPLDEITRLFPYIIEWFPEFSVIAVYRGEVND